MAASAETAKPAAQASAPSSFPNLPYRSRWIGTTDRATPTPSGKTAQGYYNPPCTEPDKPCNGDTHHGDPRDAFNNGGWTEVLDTSVTHGSNVLERVTVYGKATSPLPNGICLGSECRIYDSSLPEIAWASAEPVSEVIWQYLRRKPPGKARACSISAPGNFRDFTSHDTTQLDTVANDILNKTVHSIFNSGSTFTVIFSDNGQQDYVFKYYSIAEPVSGTFLLGSGISRCPSP